jgi:hypothetical protein
MGIAGQRLDGAWRTHRPAGGRLFQQPCIRTTVAGECPRETKVVTDVPR